MFNLRNIPLTGILSDLFLKIKRQLTSPPNSSRTNVDTLPLIPISMLTLVRTTYAVLGILKRKEAGYIRGVMDHLKEGGNIITILYILYIYFKIIDCTESLLTHTKAATGQELADW